MTSKGPEPSPVLKDMRYVYTTEDKKADTYPQIRFRSLKDDDFKGFVAQLNKLEAEHKAERREWEADQEMRESERTSKDALGDRDLRIESEIARMFDEFKKARSKQGAKP